VKIKELLKISFRNIKANKLRSALTMLGLIIGIASVIVLVGIGNGATSDVQSQVQSLGADILTVSITSSDESLSEDDLDDLADLYYIEAVAPYKSISATISRETTTSSKASILATNNNFLDVTNLTLAEGRTISIIDVENRNKVCIIGSSLATTLFSLTDPVGETVEIDGDSYTVVGLLESAGSSMGIDVDEMLLIPYTTARYLGEDTSISTLYVKVESEDYIDTVKEEIESFIRETLEISSDYYSVSSQDSVLDTMSDITNTMSLLLAGIASISLIVGGIGVMNVMLVSVTERTKEIGIRKALGAKRKDILLQFLIESLVLSVLGGILGVIIGIGVGYYAENLGYTFNASVGIVLISFSFSAIIGLVFGIFPAYRAAKLNPIDALHSE